MITVDNVSMRFNLGIEKNFSLKLFFINLFKSKKNRPKKQDFWALNNISFKIEKGEVVGFIGSNGARKIYNVKGYSRSYETYKGQSNC